MRLKSILLSAAVAMLAGPAAAQDARPVRSSALGELHFRFDSADLMSEAPSVLGKVVEFASANPDTKIVLDGHCDPVGAADYNVTLAIRRAESVREQLERMGLPNDRIVFAIYGEDGARRTTHAGDRRVTIWSTRAPLARVVDHTFARKGEAVTWQRPLTVAEIEGRTDEVASR
jgi:outer membrane protein OmpA-like peptidoglycan-associated protein